MRTKEDKVGSDIRKMISEVGKKWKLSDSNPTHSSSTVSKWDELIKNWKDDSNMPLVVRKQSELRGYEIEHETGRRIILTDNSFSQWIMFNLLQDKVFSLQEIKQMLLKDEIPFSFAIKKKDREKIKYKRTIGTFSINKLGWKLCHIDSVGLKTSTPIDKVPKSTIENHFIKLASPSNMFLVPLEIGGIGEINEFIAEQRLS